MSNVEENDWKTPFTIACIIALFFIMATAMLYSSNEKLYNNNKVVVSLAEEMKNSQEYELGKLVVANWHEWMHSDFPKKGYLNCYPQDEVMACILMSQDTRLNESEAIVITIGG